MYVHQLLASGELTGLDGTHFSFLTVDVILEQSDTYQSIIRKLGSGLKRSVAAHQRAKELAKTAWQFIQRLEVIGVKLSPAAIHASADSELLDDLVQAYIVACSELAGIFDGLLILIDEADKPESTAHLGALLKGFTERLSRSGGALVSIGLAGVSNMLTKLKESHESALRVFTSLNLKPLSSSESIEVVRKGLRDAMDKNHFETTITPEAEYLIATYSEGYPHFLQQFVLCI